MDSAERIVGEVAVLSDMAAGRLDEDGVREAARVLLEHRDYIWWSAQDAAADASGQLAEALWQLQAGKLAHEYAPSEEDLERARRELGPAPPQQDT
jgi:hypothetical protein